MCWEGNGDEWYVFGVGPLRAYGWGPLCRYCDRRLKCLSVWHGVAANGIDPEWQVARELTNFLRRATRKHADMKHGEKKQVDHERGSSEKGYRPKLNI